MLMYKLIEHGLNYSDTTSSLWFYSKDESTTFDADITNNNSKSFKYKSKLLGNIAADRNNTVLKNVTIAWRSFRMPLITCKVELKLRQVKHCVLASAGVENNNADSDIIFTINNTKLYVLVVTLLAKDNQKLSKLLSKGCIGTNIKPNMRIKVQQMSIDILLNQNL